ncbi:MAG TPA: PAS domain S-box protein [Burkholderiaceae bacterium]|nr:PAS domain S-box protein [Burkholderiaceae bacterium]
MERSPTATLLPSQSRLGAPRRFGRWPRWYWMTPVVSIALFIGMMATIIWWLTEQEMALKRDTLLRDVESAQQTMRIKLLSNQDAIVALGRDIAARQLDETTFNVQAREFIDAHRELVAIAYLDDMRIARWVAAAPQLTGAGFRRINELVDEPESFWAYDLARDDRRPTYTRPFLAPTGDVFLELHVPVFRGTRFVGSVVATYSVAQMLEHLVPVETRRKYKVSMVDEGGSHLAASTSRSVAEATLFYELPVDPPGFGVFVRAYSYSARPQFSESLLLWLVLGLCAFIVWSLIVLWRHMRRRALAEQAVVQETNFRRAMENSISTGMRAIDLQGRITYVNAAFCRMTGYTEGEFLGRIPPYPYWESESLQEHARNLDLILTGRAPQEGIETIVVRKDGTRFDARMYVSPLIDERGIQTGWMTSMTDITQAKRVRENLAAAHERFTTVLEGLDAAVSVFADDAKDQRGELLFANRYYLQWFGNDAAGHVELSGSMANEESTDGVAHEVFSATAHRWFEVRRRRTEWVDGRIVQMQIATDITQRKEAEDLSRQQQEKVALTSRLITMGEMASSIAHELNQPLTAIANYSMGTVARMRAQLAQGRTPNPEDLLPALEKTSAQAQRAGAIVRRIREFVKRSEPNRRLTDVRAIIEDAQGLVDIEAAKRRIRIEVEVQSHIPRVPVDPILIEQVLINLMKNGIDAMANTGRDRLSVRVYATPAQAPEWLAIDVVDRGVGIPEDALEKLFEPFYTTKSEGMGMGLNICRSIIEFHQGRLWAENNARDGNGEPGCTFHVWLPLVRGGARAVIAEPEEAALPPK